MPDYRRCRQAGGMYSFTVVSYCRQTILCDPEIRLALRQAISHVRMSQPFSIHAWVLMPDHLHCIWSLPEGDSDYSKRWGRIKRFVSHRCGDRYHNGCNSLSRQKRAESAIWQRRFWEHCIRDERDYKAHLDYIHYNPVKHGLVKAARDWPYSSFNRWVKVGEYQPDWAGVTQTDAAANLGE